MCSHYLLNGLRKNIHDGTTLATWLAVCAAIFLYVIPSNAQEPVPEDVWLNAPEFAPNRVPYISTYYIQPKVPINQAVTINFYVTDFFHKEYLKDDHSERFTIDYWVDGQKSTLQNVPAGGNSLVLPAFPTKSSKVLFALQATDASGRKSHRLFQEFRVIDPADEVIQPSQIYNAVLTNSSPPWTISNNNNTNAAAQTTAGLTAMLRWASSNNYRKVVLPPGGIYVLDENVPVHMATKLTLDMNGATFKLRPSAVDNTVMMQIVNCDDSHVTNGIFEGDRLTHLYDTNNISSAEAVNGILMGMGAQYSSFENVQVKEVAGYGSNTTYDGYDTNGNKISPHFAGAVTIPTTAFTLGEIDDNGNFTSNSVIRVATQNAISVTNFTDSDNFFQFGRYLGFQAMDAGSWVYKASFYDQSTNFIETIEGHMYRRMYIPDQAKFVRFTVYGGPLTDFRNPGAISRLGYPSGNLSMFRFYQPYNCAFKGIQHNDIRTAGMVPGGFYNLLVEDCTFDNCGAEITKCAFDAEDGWDMMQDLTFRNNTFYTNPNAEFLTKAGDNFVMENNTMGVTMSARTRGAVYRNNTIKPFTYTTWFFLSLRTRTGYLRTSNNTITGGITLETITTNADASYALRDNQITGGKVFGYLAPPMYTNVPIPLQAAYHYQSTIDSSTSLSARVVQCLITNNLDNAASPPGGKSFQIYDSIITNSIIAANNNDTWTNLISGSVINNTKIDSRSGGDIVLENNMMNESWFESGADFRPEREIIFRGNTIVTSATNFMNIGNRFTSITFENNKVTSSQANFALIYLQGPGSATNTNPVITVAGNRFLGNGGYVISASSTLNNIMPLNQKLYVTYSNNVQRGGIGSLKSVVTLITNKINLTMSIPKIFEDPVISVQGSNLRYSFTASTNPVAFSKVVTTTNMALSNSWTTNNVTALTPTALGDGLMRYEYEVPMAGSPQRFLRALPSP